MGLQLGPVPLDAGVVLRLVWHIPDRSDAKVGHFLAAAAVDRAVVEEQVHRLVSTGIPHLLEEAAELRLIEAVVLECEGEEAMAGANCCADCLAGLFSCAVLDLHVLSGLRPCAHCKATGCEDGLISEHQMAFFTLYALDVVIEGKSLVIELVEALGLALRGMPHQNCLRPAASLAHNP